MGEYEISGAKTSTNSIDVDACCKIGTVLLILKCRSGGSGCGVREDTSVVTRRESIQTKKRLL